MNKKVKGIDYRYHVREQRWIESVPEAVKEIEDCKAAKEGRLFSIHMLEALDGRKIGDIVLPILRDEFILEVYGNSDYTTMENRFGDEFARKRALKDVKNAIIHLLDYSEYVSKDNSDRFYCKFYRRGDESVNDIARRAIKAGMGL